MMKAKVLNIFFIQIMEKWSLSPIQKGWTIWTLISYCWLNDGYDHAEHYEGDTKYEVEKATEASKLCSRTLLRGILKEWCITI